MAAIALALAQPWKKPAPPVPAVAPTHTNSESEQLVAKAWKQLNQPAMARAELEIADGLCRRATEIDSENSDAWAAWFIVDSGYCYHALGNTLERREGARAKAARALQLAPDSFEARLAQANYLVCDGSDESVSLFAAEAERLLRALLREQPTEPRALLAFALMQRNLGHFDEARQALQTMALNPAAAVLAWHELAWVEIRADQPARALEWENRSIAVQPVRSNLTGKMMLLASWEGNLEAAASVLEQIPAAAMQEDYTASVALQVKYWRREPAALQRLAASIPREWLQSNWFRGPLAWWKGLAEQQAGNLPGARVHWTAAMKLVERRLADAPSSPELIAWQARLHAQLGEQAEAEKAWELALRMEQRGLPLDRWNTEILLGHSDSVLDGMEAALRAGASLWAATFRLAPQYDPIRNHPRFRAIQAQVDADPRCNPHAQPRNEVAGGAVRDDKSVAVLAFANLSDDKENEYFSDGISEELLNVLAKVPDLKVAARTSAFYFKGKEVPIPEIARQLGVAYVVEGSVRKQGSRVRITAQLIRADGGFHVWSDTFTRELKDIFAVQDEIAGLIARNISPMLNTAPVAKVREIAPDAYQEYLLGRSEVAKATMAGLRESLVHFERAVATEPKFTAAWVQLANARTRLGRWGGAPAISSWRAARAAIDRAVALEPDSPEVLVALGWILRTGEWKWREAERAFRRALELRPNQPDVLAGAAVLLYNIGQNEEAMRLGQRAAQLDPLNASTQIDLSIMFYLHGDLAEAETAARRALQLAPDGASYHAILAWSLIDQKRFAEAEAEIALDPDPVEQPTAYARLALARGDEATARKMIAKLDELALTNPDAADLQQSIAWISAGLGAKENDRSFAALERAKDSRDPSMAWLLSSNYLLPLQSDPRWEKLKRSMGLADDQLK